VCRATDPLQNAGEILELDEETQLKNDNALELYKEANLSKSYMILGVLLVTFASNQWSRQALYYLCDFSSNADPFKHINAAFSFNEQEYASLASFGFTVIFATVSLFAGTIVDKYDRNIVTALSCGVWSIATALQGLATGFQDLVPLRAVIGASQAFYNPAAYTMIAEIFPKKMIGSINGIFSSGVFIGGGLASLSIILDGFIGWRDTLVVVGAVGVLAAVACYFLVGEPRNNKIESVVDTLFTDSVDNSEEKKQLISGTVNAIEKKKVDFNPVELLSDAFVGLQQVVSSSEAKLLFTASALRFCAGFSIAIWKAPFVFAKFPESVSTFAGGNAAIVAGGGLLSSLLGGFLSDYLANPSPKADGSIDKPRARAWVPAIGSLLAAPFWAAFVLADSPTVAAAALLMEYLTAECWFGPTLASLFNVVPKERRGTAQGLFSVLTAAGNVAPVIVGAFAGGKYGSYALGDVLIWTVSGAYVLSGLMFAAAAIADDKRISIEWEQNRKV
jgi:MFS family permease